MVVALCVLAIAPFIGMETISLRDAINGESASINGAILWRIRIPRVMLGALCGAALAVGGVVFQAMLRNPLAAPYTLGISSGAALGAAIYVRVGIAFSLIGVTGESIAALTGAVGAAMIIYGLTRVHGGFSPATLLLAGVAISLSLSSLVLFIQYSANVYDSFRLVRWLMGGISVVGYNDVISVLPFTVAGIAIAWMYRYELNLLLAGEELARTRGVDAAAVTRTLFLAVSIMVGGVVAVCGPIGFIGIMAPHICRLILGHDHRTLIPASALFGAAFLAACDAGSRVALAPSEIPVGIVTALLGGPFFIALLIARRGKTLWQ